MAKWHGFVSLKRTNEISNFSNVILTFICVLGVMACILPILLIIAISFTADGAIKTEGYKFIPGVFSTESYRFLLTDARMVLRAYSNTIFVMVVGTAMNVVISAMYGYTLSRRDFPYRGFFSFVVLITILFSGGLAPFYYVYVRILDVKNTYWALILPGLSLGFNVFIIRTFFTQNIPDAVIESAKIDGAGELRIFFTLVMPMAMPIVATVALFSSIFYWNDFFNSMLFIDNPSLYTLQFTMQRSLMNLSFIKDNIAKMGGAGLELISQYRYIPTEGVRMAMVVIGIGPIVLLYPFLQRYFIKGLTIGAVKG